jgi:hypothetical protein
MSTFISQAAARAGTPLLVRWLLGSSAFANSTRVWLGLVAFLGVVNLYITFIGGGIETDPRAVLFSWPVIGVVGLFGLVGIRLAHLTGFPAALDARFSARQWFVVPLLLGIGFGLLESGLDLVFHWTAFFAQFSGLPLYSAAWPASLPFYAGGAILVEVVYRLLPVPLLLWLISSLLLRGRAQTQVFWVLAVLSSLIEPYTQDLDALKFGGSLVLVASAFVPDFLENLGQVIMFRKYGLLASIVVRFGFYLIWHIAYGNFICNC